MSRHSDLLYLRDMAEHAKRAVRIADSLQTFERFGEEEFLHQPALIRELEVVGEASIHVSEAFREAHQHWPWKELCDTRNHLIHGYAQVNLQVVWTTVQDDLPDLIAKLDDVFGKEHVSRPSPELEQGEKTPTRTTPSWRQAPKGEKEGPDLDR